MTTTTQETTKFKLPLSEVLAALAYSGTVASIEVVIGGQTIPSTELDEIEFNVTALPVST